MKARDRQAQNARRQALLTDYERAENSLVGLLATSMRVLVVGLFRAPLWGGIHVVAS
jgi:hypothetical protein